MANILNTYTHIFRCGGMILFPGHNVVDDKLFDSVKSHPLVAMRFDREELVLKVRKKNVEVKADGEEVEIESEEEADGINDLNVKDAKEVIKDTFNRDLLNAWLRDETRSSVKSALKDKIEELTSSE